MSGKKNAIKSKQNNFQVFASQKGFAFSLIDFAFLQNGLEHFQIHLMFVIKAFAGTNLQRLQLGHQG